MKKFLSAAVPTIFIWSVLSICYACSCVPSPTPLTAMENADAVFSGEVRSILSINGKYGKELLIRIRVRTKWKGEIEKEVVLTTADNSAACGFPFKKGESYLIYSHLYEGMLTASLCSRTNTLERAGEDLRELKAGEEISSNARCGGPTNVAAMQAFLFLFVGMLFFPRRRKINDY